MMDISNEKVLLSETEPVLETLSGLKTYILKNRSYELILLELIFSLDKHPQETKPDLLESEL